MNTEQLKKAAAKAALEYIDYDETSIIGVGTGSTTNHFIVELATRKNNFRGAVASSQATEEKLRMAHIPLFDLNEVDSLDFYVDGADEINAALQMLKGGGGALTHEKIIANVAKNFICIADITKKVNVLGSFPLPIEVIPLARSYVAREMVKLGGTPIYREGFRTDNGNVILDVWNLDILDPINLEKELNNIAGVVTNGIFALRSADILLLSSEQGVETHYAN